MRSGYVPENEGIGMKKWLAAVAAAALLIGLMIPNVSYTEDRDTVLLARAIYALGRSESYETKLALGSVAMNRVGSVWFADSLEGVLNEQHQFPIGSRYDEECLAAAHAVLSGHRTLDAAIVGYQSVNASDPRPETPAATVGSFNFYAE